MTTKTFELYGKESYCNCAHDCSCGIDVEYLLHINGRQGFGFIQKLQDLKTGAIVWGGETAFGYVEGKNINVVREALQTRINLARDEDITVTLG